MPTVTFIGHSCVIITHDSHTLIVDPFITGNPSATINANAVVPTHILVSHGHSDHFGDTIPMAKKSGATVIGSFEICQICGKEGVTTHPMNIGGAHQFPFGRVKLTIAHHSGGYGDDASRYSGPPVGFLITIGGKTIYHAGDTGLFYDMKLIGEMNDIDLAILPVGDNFTMGISDAAKAIEFLKPKRVLPIHYNTWPVINAEPSQLAELVPEVIVTALRPGGSLTL
jgi:L-ascorbate metabolism protein UlaG (beta-lactamase superfamily)